LGGLAPNLGAGMLLTLRREVLFGWRGFVRDAEHHLIEQIAVPLAEPSLLRGPVLDRRPFAGPPPDGGAALDHRLWLLLRTGPPAEVAVAPLELRGRVIGIIYVQAETELPGDTVDGLSELAHGMSVAFERLLRFSAR